MIDVENRKKLKSLIEEFLNEKIDNFDFDEKLSDIDTKDKTIDIIIEELWFFYDDLKEHKASLDKKEWDYIQRLILILDSNAEIEVKSQIKYSLTNILALISMIIFLILIIFKGIEIAYQITIIPFGLLSLFILMFNNYKKKKLYEKFDFSIYPFNFKKLYNTRKNNRLFKKVNISSNAKKNKIRSKFSIYRSYITLGLLQFMIAPIILFYQCFPKKYSYLEVI